MTKNFTSCALAGSTTTTEPWPGWPHCHRTDYHRFHRLFERALPPPEAGICHRIQRTVTRPDAVSGQPRGVTWARIGRGPVSPSPCGAVQHGAPTRHRPKMMSYACYNSPTSCSPSATASTLSVPVAAADDELKHAVSVGSLFRVRHQHGGTPGAAEQCQHDTRTLRAHPRVRRNAASWPQLHVQ